MRTSRQHQGQRGPGRLLTGVAVAFCTLGMAGAAQAATSVSWTSPASGSTFPAGTTVMPTGTASATGTTGGTGLDLAIVMDSSGSMRSTESVGGTTQSRGDWQKQFAKSLVGQLPTATTSVGIVEFDFDANTVRTLTSLTPASNMGLINSAIDSVDESGGTDIGDGIDEAQSMLTGPDATAGRARQMVVFSDGFSGSGPSEADAAGAAGTSVHSVALPGADVSHMEDIADGVDDTAGTSDDNGTFTDGTNLQALIDIFSGTGGNLVGIDRVDITLPDGTLVTDVPTDALGNFTSPGFSLAAGPNLFTAEAFGTDGTSDVDILELIGTTNGGGAQVPEPGTIPLLIAGLLGTVAVRRRLK